MKNKFPDFANNLKTPSSGVAQRPILTFLSYQLGRIFLRANIENTIFSASGRKLKFLNFSLFRHSRKTKK